MNPIKNVETENFCQLVANEYKVNPLRANQIFIDFVNEKKLVKWAWLAMKDRVQYLIKQNKGD